MPTIRIDDDVWLALQGRAQAFVDTPNDVIRRLLDLDENSGKPERPPTRTPRPPKGEITSDKDYYRPILQALIALGGRAVSRDVVERVGLIMKDRLKPADYENLSRGEIRWKTSAHFARNAMVNIERPALMASAGWGVWEITEAGREYLQQALSGQQ